MRRARRWRAPRRVPPPACPPLPAQGRFAGLLLRGAQQVGQQRCAARGLGLGAGDDVDAVEEVAPLHRLRLERDVADAHGEVQVRPRGVAGAAAVAQHRGRRHGLPQAHRRRAHEVRVGGDHAEAVRQHDAVAVAVQPAGPDHEAVRGGADGLTQGGAVDAVEINGVVLRALMGALAVVAAAVARHPGLARRPGRGQGEGTVLASGEGQLRLMRGQGPGAGREHQEQQRRQTGGHAHTEPTLPHRLTAHDTSRITLGPQGL